MSESYMKEAYAPIYQHPKWKEEANKYEENLAARLLKESYTKEAARTALTKVSTFLIGKFGNDGISQTAVTSEELKEATIVTDLSAKIVGKEEPEVQRSQCMIEALNAGKELVDDFEGYDENDLQNDMARRKRDRIAGWFQRRFHSLKRKLGFGSDKQEEDPLNVTETGMLQLTNSGFTPYEMLKAYRDMGAGQDDLLNFRLMMIAHLISSHDNSLYEILKYSHEADVQGGEDLEEAAVMYTYIDPLDTETLREEVAVQKEFPHEIVYKEMLNDLYYARKENKKKTMKRSEFKEKESTRNKAEATLNKAHMALRLYNQRIDKINEWEEKEKEITQELVNEKDPVRKKSLESNLSEVQRQIANLEDEFAVLSDTIYEIYKDDEDEKKEEDEKKKINKDDTIETKVEKVSRKLTRFTYDADDSTLYTRRDVRISGTDARLMNAQDLALNIYTGPAYSSMNLGQRIDEEAARNKLKDKDVYYGQTEEEKANPELMEQIYQMIRITARIVQETLEERGSRLASDEEEKEKHGFEGWTYRGGYGEESWYNRGEYMTETLTSTSKSFDAALEFYHKQAKSEPEKAVMAVFHLNNRSSVDVEDLSVYQTEQEVLVAKDVRFRVVRGLTRKVEIEEVWNNWNNYQPDPNVTDDDLKKEVNSNDINAIKHINIVYLEQVENANTPLAPRFQKKIRR